MKQLQYSFDRPDASSSATSCFTEETVRLLVIYRKSTAVNIRNIEVLNFVT